MRDISVDGGWISPLGPYCIGDLISIQGWRVFFKRLFCRVMITKKTALNCALLVNKKCFSFVHKRIPVGLHIQAAQKRLREPEVQVRRVPVMLTRSF